ncbi:hypothetical protein BSNK01_03950 [Bacillaceae bacterium]
MTRKTSLRKTSRIGLHGDLVARLQDLKNSFLTRLAEIVDRSLLEERHERSPCHGEFACPHEWVEKLLDCGVRGYACSRCGKQTLP